jgi:hypothetical protein
MLTNRHVVVAMLVAPVLAIIAWFAVDYLVTERPHAAREGVAYTLVAKSNCRYASGQCDLENADFRLSIRPTMRAATSIALIVTSSHPLDTAVIGLVEGDEPQAPAPLVRANDPGTEWQGLITPPDSMDSSIRIAATAAGATWYAEVPIAFLQKND